MSIPREELADRLRSRRVEIEQALLARTSAVADEHLSDDPEYRAGFRAAVSAAVEYGLSVITQGEEELPPPVPTEILNQARLAARYSVELDSVTHRYVAGSHLLDSFILEEAEPRDWGLLQRSRAAALELLLREVSAEYKRAHARRCGSRETERLRCIEGLLNGEPVHTGRLEYDLELHHVALVTKGGDEERALRQIASLLDSRLLLIRPDDRTSWAWLGRRGSIRSGDVQHALESIASREFAVAIGEPAAGLAGWRQSHRQARVSLPLALRSDARFARYCDVCLIASALQDDLLKASLGEMYLQPLSVGKDGGATHLQTLRAYFAADRNCVAAAAALGVSRQTINNRLRVIEDRLGRTLPSSAAAIELALEVYALDR